MYSHGKLVDLSQIKVERLGVRELRAHLKTIIDGETVTLVSTCDYTRAILLPVRGDDPPCWHKRGYLVARLRRRFARALESLAP
jgi:hypothetical protein